MVGLEGQALIQYYEKYKDARILPMLKTAADVLYNEVTPLGLRIWNPQKGAFLYDTSWGGGRDYGYPGLNQLIAPLYAWVYEMTGDTKYRDQGDEIFRQATHRTHCASVAGEPVCLERITALTSGRGSSSISRTCGALNT